MRKCLLLFMVLAIPAAAGSAFADDPEELGTTVEALKARLKDTQNRLDELETNYAETEKYLKSVNEMQKDAGKHEVLPSWLENLKFKGDLRLRYQGECFNYTDRSRNRARYRLRFGITKTWWEDQMEVGFRIASGEISSAYDNLSDPTSTNQTFDTGFSEKAIWIDQAYAKYTPKWLEGFTIQGGKFAVPYENTNMIWDSDVNPEGFWAQYKHKIPGLECVEPFASVGYFIVEENSSNNDVTLVGYQAGATWTIMKDLKWMCAVAYYDYDHFADNYRAANGNHVVNNELAAKEFHIFNLLNKVSWNAFNLPMSAYFDYAHNCGDEDSISPYEDQSDAYAVGITIGKNKKKGDWSFSYAYKYIEANAVVGQFNDSDFGHANRKGHVWGAEYNIDDFLTAGLTLFYTEPIVGSSEGRTTTTVQADLVWKF